MPNAQLGELPSGWRIGHIKDLVGDAVNGVWGDEPIDDGEDVYCVRAADFDRTGLVVRADKLPLRRVDHSALRKHRLRRGDLVWEKSGGGETQPVGLAVRFDLPEPAVCSNFCTRIRARDGVDARFLTYVFAATYAIGLNQRSIKQTTGLQNLDGSAFLSEPWPIPPFAEQRRIADFLDSETEKITRVLSGRQRQIELTEQWQLGQVFAAITGGQLQGEKKFSGLRWLGEIPADWPVLTVSSQFEVLLGKMLNQDRVRGHHLRPYLRNTNVQWDRIEVEDLLEMDFPPHERSRYEVRAGDLLICEGGQPGRCAIWDGRISEVYYQKALHRARSRGRSSVRWLFYCLRAATALNVFSVEGNTTTIGHLTSEQLRSHRFPFPDREIQDQIVYRLDRAADQARHVTELLTRQKGLLLERRQALITTAVTGQIDVATARGVDLP